MAKKPERKQKLKVFRTPIGFHDAYVAAPSQKAALEAWGADGNLFAQGIAEQVDDPKLMEEPLADPGKVIKRVRGSTDEHFAALDRTERKAKPKPKAEESPGAPKRKPKPKPKPRPSRDDLDAAEHALEKAEKKQRKKLDQLNEKIRELERKRRDLQRKNEAERDELSGKRDRARSAYDRAMEDWRSSSA
jgi:hypothetical protein